MSEKYRREHKIIHILLIHLAISVLGKLVKEVHYIFACSKMHLWHADKLETFFLFSIYFVL